jgi:hypothetical protein
MVLLEQSRYRRDVLRSARDLPDRRVLADCVRDKDRAHALEECRPEPMRATRKERSEER